MTKSIITPIIAYNTALKEIRKTDDETSKENRDAIYHALTFFDTTDPAYVAELNQLLHAAVKEKNISTINKIGRKAEVNVNARLYGNKNPLLFTAVDTNDPEIIQEVMYLSGIDIFEKNSVNILTYCFTRQNKIAIETFKRYMKPKLFEVLLKDSLKELSISCCKSLECLEIYFFGNDEREPVYQINKPTKHVDKDETIQTNVPSNLLTKQDNITAQLAS